MYKGIMEHSGIIPIPVKGNIPIDIICKIFNGLTLDNPLLYYVNQSVANVATDNFGNNAIVPQYFLSKDQVKEINHKLQAEINKLVFDLNLLAGDDYSKVRTVHDWFCENVKYDHGGNNLNNIIDVINAHNIVGVFAHRKAMCEGIAKAVKVLLNAVDVKCIVASGTAALSSGNNVEHAWNLVNISGQPYQLDVTFDIGVKDGKLIGYDYFLLNDESITRTHRSDVKLPACDSLNLNYFASENISFKTKHSLEKYVTQRASTGESHFYFRLEKQALTEKYLDELQNIVIDTYNDYGFTHTQAHKTINSSIGVGRIVLTN